MTKPLQTIGAKVVADHEIHVFFEVDGLHQLNGPQTTLATVAAEPLGIPDDQIAALANRYGGERIWRRASDPRIGTDLHQHVRDLLNGRREDLLTRWELESQARRLLSSGDLYEESVATKDRRKKELRLVLSKTAQARLESYGIKPTPLRVSCESLSLLLFSTGHGFIDAGLVISRADGSPLSVLELLEAQIAIGRVHKVQWVDRETGQAAGAPFVLRALVQRLALGKPTGDTAAERATTYTYLQLDEPTDVAARDEAGVHFARHYTSDYLPAPGIGGLHRVADFKTVRHTIALEGAATIVGPDDGDARLPDALRQFKTTTFQHHYLPVALLALHEQNFLIERTTSSILSREQMADQGATIAQLEAVRDATLAFRLCFHFSQVSYITMHNAVHSGFREAYGVERLLGDLGSTAAEIASHLTTLQALQDRKTAEERHDRYYWASVAGAAALGGLTTYTIVKEVAELVTFTHEQAGVLGVGGGLIVAAVAAYIGQNQRPVHKAGEHADHFTIHAMLENMIKKALK